MGFRKCVKGTSSYVKLAKNEYVQEELIISDCIVIK
jgi:hypothetical protein